MYPDPKKILAIGSGSLSIMGKPSGGEYLEDDLKHLLRFGYNSIVSLLETEEASELGLREQSDICDHLGIHFRQVPIADRSTPSSNFNFIASVGESYNAILKGANLIAHCRAGIGRSGIYTTSVLIKHGLSADDAFALVSEARGFTVPDTQQQIDWVYENEKSIQSPPN